MQFVSIISTKGGVGKTTTAANLGGFVADAGLRVLLLDFDIQPTLSSYYELRSEEHTSELKSLMRIPYPVFCFKKKKLVNYTLIYSNTHKSDKYLSHSVRRKK